MKVFYGFDSLTHLRGTVCTVGSYDGVHIGHKELIKESISQAKRLGAQSVVLTFEPHPRIVLGKAEGLKLLTTLDEKITLLHKEGVDNLVVIPFDIQFSRVSSREFMVDYLLAKLNMICVVVGHNHLFGRGNEGSYTQLQSLSEEYGFSVVQLAERRVKDEKVSSTVIRKLIAQGEIKRANSLLSQEYLIINTPSPLKLLPPEGQYIARVDGALQTLTLGEGGVSIPPSIPLGAHINIVEKIG